MSIETQRAEFNMKGTSLLTISCHRRKFGKFWIVSRHIKPLAAK
jgi:hypothetical protein